MRLTTFSLLPCVALLASALSAQNLLLNPGFEDTGFGHLDGWIAFGPNVSGETANPPSIVPETGTGLCKMYGHFNNAFNVSGVYQTFFGVPGQGVTLSCSSRHWSGDALIGSGLPNDNWAVMKIAHFDASNTEIGSAEAVILDGTFPQDIWVNNAPITSVTPLGTVRSEALILFLQPGMDGGSAQFDNVSYSYTSVPAAYPGTGEDLALSTGVGGNPASTGPQNDIKTAVGGSLLELNVSSPGGTFHNIGYWLVGELFATGSPVVPSPAFPELWFGFPTHFILVSGIPTPIGTPIIRPNGGSSTFFNTPQGLTGVSVMVQALVINSVVANSVYAASDAHEIQFQ